MIPYIESAAILTLCALAKKKGESPRNYYKI